MRAREIPVFPEVGSMIVVPGESRPSFSSPSIIANATRSLTEPVGFAPSSFIRMVTPGFGERAEASTIGV
jgi:hypothetical protein